MSTDAEITAWVPYADSFGARLALVRQRMGWNMKEAALACGLKYNTWRSWELEGREPHKLRDVCLQIASNTGCNHIWLQTGEDHPTPPVPPAGFEPAAFCSEDFGVFPHDDVDSCELADVTPIRRASGW
jgi:hypothetical protein